MLRTLAEDCDRMFPARCALYALLLCIVLIGHGAAGDAAELIHTPVIQFVEAGAEQITLHLSTSSSYTQAALAQNPAHQRPDRCYIDVSGVVGQRIERAYPVHSDHVRQVRVAQFQPYTVRVVLDLTAPHPCYVEDLVDPDRLQITVGRRTRESAASRPLDDPVEVSLETIQPTPAPSQEPSTSDIPLIEPVSVAAQESPDATMSGYLDLRTPLAPELQAPNPVSLFGQPAEEEQSPQLTPLPPGSLFLLQGPERQ